MLNRGDEGAGAARGSLAELRELLKGFDTAMLVTMTPEGLLRGRPMALPDPAEMPDCDLWFVTSDETAKVDEITREHQVAVCCFRPRDRAYASISALARIERDPVQVGRLWRPEWSAWVPGGPDNPHAAILKLKVEKAEYWEPEGGRLRTLYERARAAVQGRSPAEVGGPPKRI